MDLLTVWWRRGEILHVHAEHALLRHTLMIRERSFANFNKPTGTERQRLATETEFTHTNTHKNDLIA